MDLDLDNIPRRELPKTVNEHMGEGFDVERELKGKQKGGHMENWELKNVGEGKHQILTGNCYGDIRWSDGTWVRTSLVVKHHKEADIVETRNTYYTLGKPKGVDLKKHKPVTKEQLDMLIGCMV